MAGSDAGHSFVWPQRDFGFYHPICSGQSPVQDCAARRKRRPPAVPRAALLFSLEPTVVFADYEVPVAYSMVRMATRFKEGVHPLEVFTCYWAAFNNIYVTI